MSKGRMSKADIANRKARFFKALDLDPHLSYDVIRQRFGFGANTICAYKREWKEANTNED